MNPSFTLQIEQSLRNLGFTRHEVKAFIYLIRKKQTNSRTLSRETAIPYSMTKAVLANLVRRELIKSELVNGHTLYSFTGEAAFRDWLTEEQAKHKSIYEKAEQDMSQFFSNAAHSQWQPEVLFYEGAEGIKEIYEDMLHTGEDIYTCTDVTKLLEILGEDYLKKFVATRKEKNICLYTIRSEDVNNIAAQTEGFDENELRKVKISGNTKLNGEIKVYGQKSALITFEGDNPVGFVFSGGPTAELMKQFFWMQWNNID